MRQKSSPDAIRQVILDYVQGRGHPVRIGDVTLGVSHKHYLSLAQTEVYLNELVDVGALEVHPGPIYGISIDSKRSTK